MFFRMHARIVLAGHGRGFVQFRWRPHAAEPALPLPVRSEKIASAKVGETREF